MPLTASEQQLLFLLKQKKNQIALLKNGVRIQTICGAPIDDLLLVGASARVELSRHFLEAAQKFRRMRPGLFRNSVSRSYYSMYHAARAIAFVDNSGDDNEAHNDVHRALPTDFPDVDRWKNDIKDARLLRNEADYEPYPTSDADFESTSKDQATKAAQFLALTEQYLRAKGCQI